ncbi:hypothetical protein R6Q59_003155 [Mikania micrantha]
MVLGKEYYTDTQKLVLFGKSECYSKIDYKRREIGHIKITSEEVCLISKNSSATVGQVGNVRVNQKSLDSARSKRWLCKRHIVIGVVMNIVYHPHMGDEWRAQLVEKTTTTSGNLAVGKRSRKRNKYSDDLILHRRSKYEKK